MYWTCSANQTDGRRHVQTLLIPYIWRKAMTRYALLTTLPLAAFLSVGALADNGNLHFTKVWTYGHTTAGQVSEIPAYDERNGTVWVAGVVGVDVIDVVTGALIRHIDVTPYGFVNSVAIHDDVAALAVEAAPDRRRPGKVVLYDTATGEPASGVNEIVVGALPDMLTFTHNGRRLLVANEGTPNAMADTAYQLPPADIDPPGTVSIIDVKDRRVLATSSFTGVPTTGSNLRTNVGMDFEPEYIAVSPDDRKAYVTLQEANGIAVLDLRSNRFERVIGLGAKDFNLPGNEIDPNDDDGVTQFSAVSAKGLYMPDSIAAYKRQGRTFLVLANEGDFREDNVDRSTATAFGAISPLNRLRVSNVDSSPGNLFAAGARSFSIRDESGKLVFDSGSTLDRAAAIAGIYDEGRSRDKGVEPEGVTLLEIAGRNYAFIGLERATSSAVAVFDVSNPSESSFIDLIVTPGDRAPEGLAVFERRGTHYLVISNETVGTGATTTHTSLYRIDRGEPSDAD